AFKKLQVLAAAMDPRSKSLYGIESEEHSEVWDAVVSAAVDIELANNTAGSAPPDGGGGAGSPIAVGSTPSAPSAPRQRRRGFAAAAAAQPQVSGTAIPSSSTRHLEGIDSRELDSFKTAPGVDMSSYDKEGKVVLGDPLQWWRVKAREYPMLAALARRVLCIPASQAHSERVFSAAGQI
ncbi:unnamed protein product, partial [Hapterophycus canaliculatus]